MLPTNVWWRTHFSETFHKFSIIECSVFCMLRIQNNSYLVVHVLPTALGGSFNTFAGNFVAKKCKKLSRVAGKKKFYPTPRVCKIWTFSDKVFWVCSRGIWIEYECEFVCLISVQGPCLLYYLVASSHNQMLFFMYLQWAQSFSTRQLGFGFHS